MGSGDEEDGGREKNLCGSPQEGESGGDVQVQLLIYLFAPILGDVG